MKDYTSLLLLFTLSCESPFVTKPTDGDIFEVSHDFDGEKIYNPTPVVIEWSNITIKKFKEFLVERSATDGDSTVWEEIAHIEDSLQIAFVDTIDDDITYQYRVRITDQDDQFIHALSEPFTVPNVSSLNVPNHYENPQEAYNSKFMDDGDSVSVFPGLYRGHFQFLDKNVTIRSTTIPEITLLAANPGIGSVVKINRGILKGFTVIGGRALYGGGVSAEGSAAIKNCIIKKNRAIIDVDANMQIYPNGMGGGVFLSGESSLEKCKIIENFSNRDGGGVVTEGDNIIIDCIVKGNRAFPSGLGSVSNYAGIYQVEGTLLIRNTKILSNGTNGFGGALGVAGDANVWNCLIQNNYAPFGGGGIYVVNSGNIVLINSILYKNRTTSRFYSGSIANAGEIEIFNSIIYQNSGIHDYKLYARFAEYTLTDEFRGAYGVGNLKLDPIFVNINEGNFHLSSDSPCIDAGHPGDSYTDANGTRNDMGIYGGPYGDD